MAATIINYIAGLQGAPNTTINLTEGITINFVAGLQGPPGPGGMPDLAALPKYKDDDEAKANGLGINDSYVVATGSDVLVAGTVKLIIE